VLEDFIYVEDTQDTQAALIKFLVADLKVVFTELKTAEIDAPTNPDQSRCALAKARVALKMVRRFEGRVEDAATARNIQARADALESALNSLMRPQKRTQTIAE